MLTVQMPVFLMAGQSNMVGNPDTTLFNTLPNELAFGTGTGIETRLVSDMHGWYFSGTAYPSYGWTDTMAAFEASELVRLNAAGLVGANLTTPDPNVLCSLDPTPVAPLTTNCGNPFGPELVMGRVLGKAGYAPTSLIKVAVGGTTLAVDWRSPLSGGTVGPLYLQLRARIKALVSDPASVHPECVSQHCQWEAFIWFQGENDSFDSANAAAYAQSLKNLSADVRSDAGLPELPVVIIQIGPWAQSLSSGGIVAAAQQSAVTADKQARLVNTTDLSGFYHFDPAAQLIIGERTAKAVQLLLMSAARGSF